ncbi:MAG: hypothetical protein ACOC78_00880, partial [Actinomycetota bacterium]
DTEQLGMVINGVTGLVKELHEGNLLLGREEPRLRSVFSDFSEDLLLHVDKEQAALAVLALAEDMETITRVAGELLYRDPDLLVLSAAASISSIQALMRGASDAMNRVAQLPESSLNTLVDEIGESLEPQAAARLLTSLMDLGHRLLDASPELPAGYIRDFLSALDTDLIGRVSTRAASSIMPALIEELDITPSKAGTLISTCLSAYNRSAAENPEAASAAVSLVLDEIDPAELRGAADHALGSAARAVAERPELLGSLIRPIASASWNMLKDYLMRFGKRLRGGSRGPR